MKPPPFAYLDPRSVPEVLEVLAQHGDDGKILAGGQSLVPLLNMRLAQPGVLIDLNRVPGLAHIEAGDREGAPGVRVGTMTRQRALEDADGPLTPLPLLREALGFVGHPQIRNRGTVGGSIAHADPAAELPLVFRALDGVATVQSSRAIREVPAADFFLYTFTPAMEPDEALVDLWFPFPSPRTGQCFVEVARRHGDFALVAAAASLTLGEDGSWSEARIAIAGAAPVPLRATRAEEAMVGERASLSLFREVARLAAEETDPTSDVHADAAYRREVAGVLVYRALTTAWERVPGEGS